MNTHEHDDGAEPAELPLLPLGVANLGDAPPDGAPDPFDAAPRRAPRRLAVAALVLLGAAGGIFAMRQMGMGPGSALAGLVLEFKPATSDGADISPRLLADLERSRRAVQVPAEVIDKDPFRLRTSADAPVTLPTDDPEAIARAEAARQARLLEEQRERRRKELDAVFARLDLQGDMAGSLPIARISGSLFRVGDTVEGVFTVKTIEGRTVVLTADDTEWVLEFGAPGSSTTPRSPSRPPSRRN